LKLKKAHVNDDKDFDLKISTCNWVRNLNLKDVPVAGLGS
jgi:hypothetical protein